MISNTNVIDPTLIWIGIMYYNLEKALITSIRHYFWRVSASVKGPKGLETLTNSLNESDG